MWVIKCKQRRYSKSKRQDENTRCEVVHWIGLNPLEGIIITVHDTAESQQSVSLLGRREEFESNQGMVNGLISPQYKGEKKGFSLFHLKEHQMILLLPQTFFPGILDI
jgi:hypothetical protein